MSWSQLDAIRWVAGHPLNRDRIGAALIRWTAAQLRAHLLRTPRLVPFVADTRLYVGPGLTSANMQHYAGIGELDVMGFLMHYLRPDDTFVDVGANVGVATVLASAVVGAETVALEPDPENFLWLARNVAANAIDARVRCIRAAAGEVAGSLDFTAGRGAANRVTTMHEPAAQTVPCDTLDRLLDGTAPTVLKADTEGFELPVLRGAGAILADRRLGAVVLELKNHGARYGFDEDDVRAMMAALSFSPFSYDPIARRLIQLTECPRRPANTIFLRYPVQAAERLKNAPLRRVIWDRQL